MAEQGVQLSSAISCAAWNSDFTELAVCPHSNDIHIFDTSYSPAEGWIQTAVLQAHDQLVSGLDWAPSSNLIASCSHDRNAFVWERTPKGWTHQMVVTKLSRAALCVKWSGSESKFAIGSGSKVVCICYLEQDNNWWVAKLIKRKHFSSITSVSWHPNEALLATSSTDCKVRIFNAVIEGMERTHALPAIASKSSFGELLWEVELPCWVHSVDFSPCGRSLAAACHDSAIRVYTISADSIKEVLACETLPLPGLPMKVLHFLSSNMLVGGGWDGEVVVFSRCINGIWEQVVLWEEGKQMPLHDVVEPEAEVSKGISLAGAAGGGRPTATPFTPPRTGAVRATSTGRDAPARHSNCIMGITKVHHDSNAFTVATVGLDGRLLLWQVELLLRAIQGLNLWD